MPTPPPKDRVRATKLRGMVKVGKALTPEDAAWLHDYETAREEVARGASRSHVEEHRIETREAVGSGSAAEVAAAAALSREEGRRYDHLLDGAIRAMQAANGFLKEACAMHQQMAEVLLKRSIEDGEVVRSLLTGYRSTYLEKAELERDAILAESGEEKDGVTELANTLLPVLMQRLGGTVGAVAAGAARKRPQRRPPVKPEVVPPGAPRTAGE